MPDYEPTHSNLRPAPLRPRDFSPGVNGNRAPSPRVTDEILGSEIIETPRKRITLSRRTNRNGEFLRLDEERPTGEHNAVIIPGECIEEVFAALEKLFPETPGE